MTRKEDINYLLEQLDSEYSVIEKLYAGSLKEKELRPELRIKIKNYLENARSVLDYCAHDIAEKLQIESRKIYFPILDRKANEKSFEGIIGANLPGLKSKNIDVYNYLKSIQPIHQEYFWLADFAEINIDSKHYQLTPQIKSETERIVSERRNGGSYVSWNPSCVRFGPGVFINGAPVNPFTQMPESTPDTTIRKEIWVDFQFNGKISALPLLEKIKSEIPIIIKEVYSKI